eukprot:2631193-Pleurochrysis_carterae.AAC.3
MSESALTRNSAPTVASARAYMLLLLHIPSMCDLIAKTVPSHTPFNQFEQIDQTLQASAAHDWLSRAS